MKSKIIILFLLLFCSFPAHINAQVRFVDLENKFLKPTDSHFLKMPDSLHISFSVKNLGPDSLFIGDSINYSYLFTKRFPHTTHILTKDIFPGDSVIISETIFVPDPPTNEKFTDYSSLAWGAFYPRAWNRAKSPHPPLSLDKDIRENSEDHVMIKWAGSQNKVQNIALNNRATLYPNPFNDLINIKAHFPMEEVNIVNMKGAVLLNHQANLTKDTHFSTENLSAGIHLVLIQYSNGLSETVKITKL